jgi:peptidoglycan/LPS O-acetylase OafA/YrhL
VILTWSLLARADCEGPLAAPGLVFAGEASFALYLVHMPVIVAWKGVVAELRGVDSTFRITPVELIGLFIATALIAAALHLLVEKPGRTWIRRRFDRRRDELAPAALSPPALREPDDR